MIWTMLKPTRALRSEQQQTSLVCSKQRAAQTVQRRKPAQFTWHVQNWQRH